jgi:hypothetical protein
MANRKDLTVFITDQSSAAMYRLEAGPKHRFLNRNTARLVWPILMILKGRISTNPGKIAFSLPGRRPASTAQAEEVGANAL